MGAPSQETHKPVWMRREDDSNLKELQSKLSEMSGWDKRYSIPEALGYAITAGLVVGKLMEALEFYAEPPYYRPEEYPGTVAREALELARKELEGAQR